MQFCGPPSDLRPVAFRRQHSWATRSSHVTANIIDRSTTARFLRVSWSSGPLRLCHSTTSSLPSHHLLQSTRCGPTRCSILSHTIFESDFSPPPTFPSTSGPRYLTSMNSRKHQHWYQCSLWLYKKPTNIDMYVSRLVFVPIARHLSTLADILLLSSPLVASFRPST